MKSDDKQANEVDRLALLTFKKYFGRKPGKGAWPIDHDARQLTQYIEPLVFVWQRRMRGMDVVGIDHGNALDCARSIGINDRPYVLGVRNAYNDVMHDQANV